MKLNGFDKLFLPAVFGVLLLSTLSVLVAASPAGNMDDREVLAKKMLVAEVREKCAPLFGTRQWESCMAEARESLGIDVSAAARQSTDMRIRARQAEKKKLYDVVSESHGHELLGRACAFVLSASEVKKLIQDAGLTIRYPEFFTKLALSAVQKEKIALENQIDLEVNGQVVTVSRFVVMARLMVLVEKDSPVYLECRERVSEARREKALEYKDAKLAFQEEWKELKEFRGSDEAERNRRLGRAIEALITARIKIAGSLASRGAPAENVSAFVSYLGDVRLRAENASFEERKAILREINGKWREFVKDMTGLFFKKKIEAHVAKLTAFIIRANEAITGLEERGVVPQERIALLKTASHEASEATDAVLEEDGSLRQMMKRLLVARAKVHRLVKMIGKVQNGLADVDVEEEAVTDSQVANVPDVSVQS